MEALAARGNVAEAMRVFDALRTLLRDELGTSPSPEAIAAHERLLRPQAHGAGATPVRAQAGRAGAAIPLPADLRQRRPGPPDRPRAGAGRARGAVGAGQRGPERLGASSCCWPAMRGSARPR